MTHEDSEPQSDREVKPSGVGFDVAEGGLVAVPDGANVRAPSALHVSPYGVGFGPVHLGVPPGERLVLDRVEFLPDDVDNSFLSGWGFLSSSGTVGAAAMAAGTRGDTAAGGDTFDEPPDEDDRMQMTRRDVVRMGSALVVMGAMSGVAAGGHEVRPVVEVDVREATAPILVEVFDAVENVLPFNDIFHVEANGARLGEFEQDSQRYAIDGGTETIRLYLKDAVGQTERFGAWLKGIAAFDDELQYEMSLNTSLVEGERYEVSSHPAVVDPVDAEGGGGTIFHLDGESVPHSEEREHAIGEYDTVDGRLIYKAGSAAPSGDQHTVEMRLRAPAWSTMYDGARRAPSFLTDD